MSGKPVKECIDNVSFLSLSGMEPLPVPHNKLVPIYGYDIYRNYYSFMVSNITSKICIIGHPGLMQNGLDRTIDNDKTYAPPSN
jgi:hypothetical protein